MNNGALSGFGGPPRTVRKPIFLGSTSSLGAGTGNLNFLTGAAQCIQVGNSVATTGSGWSGVVTRLTGRGCLNFAAIIQNGGAANINFEMLMDGRVVKSGALSFIDANNSGAIVLGGGTKNDTYTVYAATLQTVYFDSEVVIRATQVSGVAVSVSFQANYELHA